MKKKPKTTRGAWRPGINGHEWRAMYCANCGCALEFETRKKRVKKP